MLLEVRRLEIVVGQFMVYWGFKSIHGRIWLHLYLSSEALDSAELIERLRVSKGLMSTAIRQLLKHKVIQAASTGAHGTVYYEANPKLQDVIAGVLRQRERVFLKKAEDGCRKLSKLNSKELSAQRFSKERVESILSMTTSAQLVLEGFLLMSQNSESLDFERILDLSMKRGSLI